MDNRSHAFQNVDDLLSRAAIPPFSAMRAFEAVGRLGGIRRAATYLSLDHTVVSRHMRQLESWLGSCLFERSSGRLVLTAEGEAYHARVSDALIQLATATATVRQQPDQLPLKVWCVPGFANRWLSHQIPDFEKACPNIQVELRPTEDPPNLLMHEADVDIRFYGNDWGVLQTGAGVQYMELASPDMMPVASPEVALQLKGMKSAVELMKKPLLHEEHQEQWRAWFKRNSVDVPERLNGPLCWNAHLAIDAAKQGRGIALANRFLASADIASGNLIEIMPTGSRPVALGRYVFAASNDRWMLPKIRKFRQFIQSRVS